MGYTHYFYRNGILDRVKFCQVVSDFKKLMPIFSAMDIKLADGTGKFEPEITDRIICFNGLEECGHHIRDLGITWPADDAKGISYQYCEELIGDKLEGNVITVFTGDPTECAKYSDVKGS